jgi:RNA polymerase sigma factor (sigma-70 family)
VDERTAVDDLAPNGWPWSLLRGFREGRTLALQEVYRMHAEDVARQLRFGFSFESRGRAHRFAGYHGGFELHDALHETFRRAFEPRARQGYDGLRPYGPYLKAIARNVVLRTFRTREILFPAIDDPDEEPSVLGRAADENADPEIEVASRQVRDLVARFLESLAPDERALVEVRFVEGKSQRDAAATLGLGRQQIRGREAKLRAKLAAFLREQGEDAWMPASSALLWLVMGRILAEVVS